MKKIMTSIMTFVVVIAVCLMFSYDHKTYQSDDDYALGKIALILEENGKFSYVREFKKATLTYPTARLDSAGKFFRIPNAKISFYQLSKDSFSVSISIPTTKILVDMDSLKFIYPPDAKFSIPEDIWWKKTDRVALSPKFWIVGKKDSVTNVYTPEGKIISPPLSKIILTCGKDEPLPDDSTH